MLPNLDQSLLTTSLVKGQPSGQTASIGLYSLVPSASGGDVYITAILFF